VIALVFFQRDHDENEAILYLFKVEVIMLQKSFKVGLLAISTIIFLIFFNSPAFAKYETLKGIELEDGTIIEGKILEWSDYIRIETKEGKIFKYRSEDVTAVLKEGDEKLSRNENSPSVRKPENKTNLNYIALKAGAYTPNSSDLEDFNTGFNGEVAFGHYLSKNAAIELGIGYSQTESPTYYGYMSQTGNYNGQIDIQNKPVTLSLKLIAPIDIAEFYVLGGIGANFVHGEIDVNTQLLGSASISDDKVAFLGQLGAGLNFNINPNFFIGVEGKYIWSTVDFEQLGSEISVDLDGFVYTGVIGFRF